ncbi:hypothetical protein [Ornithinimicrobium sufpigmenti]|uniref:hypothetical protein n=1 Tax=Ornithinimicrobium sufpigmenti TaxID=2508882 RepID=UPI0010367BE4|nr:MULTISPECIES: hypothetical protein [unclassified Ornithinimicrobium]
MSGTDRPRAEKAPAAHLARSTPDEWVPEDRAPSAAENNFMSVVLFGFLIAFGISCFVLF